MPKRIRSKAPSEEVKRYSNKVIDNERITAKYRRLTLAKTKNNEVNIAPNKMPTEKKIIASRIELDLPEEAPISNCTAF